MKKFALQNFSSMKYFVFGILIAFSIHIISSCSKSNSPTEPESTNPPAAVDEKKIEEGAKAAEDALKTGDVQKVLSTLSEDAKTFYGTQLNSAAKEELIKIGEALNSKSIVVYTESYAEYKYTKDGQEYSIALSRQVDGTWKLMRF